MDNRSLTALEFPKILNNLAGYCQNDEAKTAALALRPKTELYDIEPLLSATDEALAMTLCCGRPPISANTNIKDYLQRARIRSTLQMDELLRIAALLRTASDMIHYFDEDDAENRPYLEDAFGALDACEDLEESISHKILSDHEMADNASRELARIRREKVLKNRRISEKLNALITSAEHEKHLQDKIITMRGGRYVVPVKAEYRGTIPGIMLDRSSSGQTVFVEPMAVVELNNELRVLEAEEKDEIERILKELTEHVGIYSTVIEQDYDILIELDLVFAKALYALDIGANRIALLPHGKIELRKAVHPLLDQDTAVASDIRIDKDIHTMVITGPNTGGKTVTLKTLGLLSAMIQSGMFIPVKEGSSSRLFNSIYADIGDEQSIEQSLSTFSSHMTNIVEILNQAGENDLVLFDELGAGTDPIEGAALAQSILEAFGERGTLSIATTHYSELKEYGLTTPGVLNASVEFDVKTLRPTYRLMIGMPGKSNAFEIAKRLGIDKSIIDSSRNKVSGYDKKLDQTLAAAEAKLSEAEEMRRGALEMQREASDYLKKAESKQAKMNEKAEGILKKAQDKAGDLIAKTKKETDLIYREIQQIQREAAASIDNKTLEKLRRDLSAYDKAAQKSYVKASNQAKAKNSTTKLRLSDFKQGDRVYIKSLDREADVLSIRERDKKIEIQSGNMKMQLKPEELLIIKPEPKKQNKVSLQRSNVGAMNTTLDLRGKTVEESVYLLEKFLADAIMLNQKQLTVIHGHGTGLVRNAVHDYLKKSNLIDSYRLGGPGEGSTGATIITL